MGRRVRFLAVLAMILGVTAGPAWAMETVAGEAECAVIDIRPFVPDNFVDVNGDCVPDLGELEEGEPGIWDDLVGAQTPEQFLARIDTTGARFDLLDDRSEMRGPCGGVAILYDEDGLSIDALYDAGDDDPILDVYTGEQAMTADNPVKVNSAGVIAYFGFTEDVPTLSLEGFFLDDYGPQAPAFHDHQWQIDILGVSADFGGDPNEFDKNRNAGLVELGEELPLRFRAKLKARGAIIDLWGEERLDSFDSDTIAGVAAGREFCFGEGWVEFVGDGFPLFEGPGAISAVLAVLGFSGVLFNARPAQTWRAG